MNSFSTIFAPVRVPDNEGGREPPHRRKERVDDIVCARRSAHAQQGGHLPVEHPVNIAEILNASIRASHDRGSLSVVVALSPLSGRHRFASYSGPAKRIKPRMLVGIDPGLSGALFFLDPTARDAVPAPSRSARWDLIAPLTSRSNQTTAAMASKLARCGECADTVGGTVNDRLDCQ